MFFNYHPKKRQKEEELESQRVAHSVERIKQNVKGDLNDPYDHFDALRVCDKKWFDGLTETIEYEAKDGTQSTQIRDPRVIVEEVETSKSDLNRMSHSYTDNQISNKHGQSPKLPQGIRDIQHSVGSVMFTGRLPMAKDVHDSHETLTDRPVTIQEIGASSTKPDEIPDSEKTENTGEKKEPTVIVAEEISPPGCVGCMSNLFVDLLIYSTRVLNTRTQAYRSIIIQLKKDRQECRQGMPPVASRKYAGEIKRNALKQSFPSSAKSAATSASGEDIRSLDNEQEIQSENQSTSYRRATNRDSEESGVQFVSPDAFDQNDHYMQRLLSAIWYFGQFQIDNVCYTLMVLNGMFNASLLSIPYLGFVFLWAMLSVPRPSKRFWVTAIVYTCCVIIIKYLFAFRFWSDVFKDQFETQI